MKVKQLLRYLEQAVDPEATVVLAADVEGNRYQPARSLAADMNFFESDQEVAFTELTKDLAMQGYTEEDIRAGGVPAFVLWV